MSHLTIDDFAVVYRNVVVAVHQITALVRRELERDRLSGGGDSLSGPHFVARFVRVVRDEAGDAIEILKRCRTLLEDASLFQTLTSEAACWRTVWDDAPNQTRFRELCTRSIAFDRAGAQFRWSPRGYVFHLQGDTYYPDEHRLECLMELLAAVWCGLLLSGIRADGLWSQILRLAGDDTNGLPSGACVFKAYGDVYRHALRELDSLVVLRDSSPAAGGRAEAGGYIKHENLRIRHVMLSPSLFHLGEPASAQDHAHLSPGEFRAIAELYYVLYQIAYLRSGQLFTLLWLYEPGSASQTLDKAAPWLKYALGRPYASLRGRPVTDLSVFLSDESAKWAFWARPADTASGLPTCVLGLRYGVLAISPDLQSERARWSKDAATDVRRELPAAFGGRRIADDMFRSLVLTVRGSVRLMRDHIIAGNEGEGFIDCLEYAYRPVSKTA